MSLIAAAPASSAARARPRARTCRRAPARRPRRRAARSPGTSLAASSSAATGGPLRAATAPTSSRSKPASTSASPSATACSGVPLRAPAKNESSVTLTIPAAERRAELERAVGESPGRSPRSKLVAAMALRCVYTDLDGTLLGPRGSLFRDPDGNFSMTQARALEACHRAGVEVVIMSGRRESHGALRRAADRPDLLHLRGRLRGDDRRRADLPDRRLGPRRGRRTPAERMLDAGIPDLLFERFAPRSSGTRRGTPSASSRCCCAARSTSPRPTRCSREHGHDDLRFLDNGAIGRPMEGVEGRPTPTTWSPAGRARRRASPSTCRRAATRPRTASRSATRSRTSSRPRRSAASSCVANGPERDQALREALARFPNATVTEGAMGDGFYEAVVSTPGDA